MILEQPPRALPVLLLVRKMLNLVRPLFLSTSPACPVLTSPPALMPAQTELIVEESLPGLPSMHYPLFLVRPFCRTWPRSS